MKIIREGAKPENDTYRGTCARCDTEIEFLRREAEYVSDQRDGESLKIACPTCGRYIWVAVRSKYNGPGWQLDLS